MKNVYNDVGILSVASALPSGRIQASELAEKFKVSQAVFDERIHLIEKPVAQKDDEHPSHLAAAAAAAALEASGRSAEEVGLVLFTGVSKDYLGSWSVALDVIGRLGLTHAIGYDLSLGCAGPIAAMEIARTRQVGPPLTLVTTAERWTQTISSDVSIPLAFAAHADGGAACLLGPDAHHQLAPAALFVHPEYNGFVVVPAGGTREPASLQSIEQLRHFRTVPAKADGRIIARYIAGYQRAIDRALELAGIELAKIEDRRIELLLTNQVRPAMRAQIHAIYDIPPERTVNTYPRLGHLGAADIFVGLERAVRDQKLRKGITVLASSANNAFGSVVLQGSIDGGIAVPS